MEIKMAKRFIDTELWDKPRFNMASPKIKLLTLFITCKCDQVGLFKMSPILINAYIGEPVTDEDILSIPCDIIKVSENVYWLEKFCQFQYGELSDSCKPHKKYIEMLKSYNLFERVSKGYPKGIHTLQEKEKEKEEDKEKEKDKEKEEEKDKEKETKQNFKKPTIEEITDFCTERNNGIDAEKFYHFYESKNWLIGKNKMKDWKSAVITWEKGNKQSNQKSNQPINIHLGGDATGWD